jgi:hypothetical protein
LFHGQQEAVEKTMHAHPWHQVDLRPKTPEKLAGADK